MYWSSPGPKLSTACLPSMDWGVLVQLVALWYFLRAMIPHLRSIQHSFSFWVKMMIGIALACLIFKILLQGAVIVPGIAQIAYTIRNFVIGFFHLILLGVISHFLLGYGMSSGLLSIRSPWIRVGLILFSTGFVLSEIILFVQGLMFWGGQGFLPAYYETLFGVSALMLLGLVIVLMYWRRDS